jgi:membrane associated rhomboid family serine protease
MIPLRDDNQTLRKALVTPALVGACVLVYLWQLTLGQQGGQAAVYALGVIPAVLLGRDSLPVELAVVAPPVTVFTSMFMHGGFMHLAGNMLYLWIFGDNVEDSMGRARFLVFYLLCGVAAVAAQALPDPDSVIPMIGASGAISGVLGAYLLLYPHAKVLVGVPLGFVMQTFSLRAGLVLAFWFGLQLMSNLLSGGGEGGGVAFRAHIGGFIAGMLLIPLFKRRELPLRMPFGGS